MSLSPEQEAKLALFQKHVAAELAGDLETTMATMSEDPHLINVPTKVGGVGREVVRSFYRDHLVARLSTVLSFVQTPGKIACTQAHRKCLG